MFCRAGVAGTASRPRLAVILPNSSKAAAFISSWIALGSSVMPSLAVGACRVLNPNRSPPCSEMRAQAVAAGAGAAGGVAPAAGGEARAVGRVVGSLPDDDRVLAGLEHAGAVRLVPEGRLERGQVEGRRRRGRGDLDLHDGAGVRAVAGQDGRCADRAQVRGAGVVVIAGDPGREGRRGVVVQDQRLAGELREVDDHVGPLGRRQQQRVQVHVADVEAGRVGDPGDRLVRDDHRSGQEAALGADLDPAGPGGAPGGVRRREDDRVESAQPPVRRGSARPRCRSPSCGSATYHCRFQKRSLAAFRIRRR